MRNLPTAISLSYPVQHEQFHTTESPSRPEEQFHATESASAPEDEDRNDSVLVETSAVMVSSCVRDELAHAYLHF